MITSDEVGNDVLQRALTMTEVADRAGYDPEDLVRFPLNYMPYAVLARLSETLRSSPFPTPSNPASDPQEKLTDKSTVGAYLAEIRGGITRDALAEALDWRLLRVERALAALDASLRSCGLRLALHAGRITIVGRLERTRAATRISFQRLQTPEEIEPAVATLVYGSLYGIADSEPSKWNPCEVQEN